jgi:hypothetical protein
MRRREPASRELAANDANPGNAERGRHDANAMERRSFLVKTRVRAGGEIGRDKSFRSSETSAMMSEREIAGAEARRIRFEGLAGKRRNEKPVKPLKTHDSAKSRDFAPNDFNSLPFRFISLGEMFLSFGAWFCPRRVPPEFMRKEMS